MTKTPPSQSRFEHLQDAIKSYGAAAFENLMRCKGIGDAIIEAFPAYIECGQDCVRAVPPAGEFDPRKDYGDLAFSYSQREIIVLEPIHFGIALTVKNFEDSGALWLRTAIAVEVTGDSFDIFVAQQPIIHVPLDYKGKLEPVLEAIYQEFMHTFKIQVLEFNDKRFATGIGFLPTK
ncbi:MAG: hypothetical protein DHS20C05_12340 [Hyphococcus sp.]|nr:MAG: hypothetical protein DHS20C05_12340 [Marinicaulis sp.]